jgi:hypothetical protein
MICLEGSVVADAWCQWDFNQKQLIQAAALTPPSSLYAAELLSLLLLLFWLNSHSRQAPATPLTSKQHASSSSLSLPSDWALGGYSTVYMPHFVVYTFVCYFNEIFLNACILQRVGPIWNFRFPQRWRFIGLLYHVGFWIMTPSNWVCGF